MAFDKKLLHDHEDLVLDLRPHWWYMARVTLVLVAAVVLGVVVLSSAGDGAGWDVARYASIAFILAALVWFVARYAKWVTTNFVVTSDRLIYRVGVVAKSGIEIPLERVNTVFFNQSVFERMLGAGDLSIESGGERGTQAFSDIRKPSLVQNEIYRQMEINNERMYHGTGTGGGGSSVGEELERLDALRQRGVLTQAEFDAQKAELLRRT